MAHAVSVASGPVAGGGNTAVVSGTVETGLDEHDQSRGRCDEGPESD
jgi:hypothetical protein